MMRQPSPMTWEQITTIIRRYPERSRARMALLNELQEIDLALDGEPDPDPILRRLVEIEAAAELL